MSAPAPRVIVDGLGSERFALMGSIQVTYACPACKFHSGASYPYVKGSDLPPELRDLAAWEQEADYVRAELDAARYRADAMFVYSNHVCEEHPKR